VAQAPVRHCRGARSGGRAASASTGENRLRGLADLASGRESGLAREQAVSAISRGPGQRLPAPRPRRRTRWIITFAVVTAGGAASIGVIALGLGLLGSFMATLRASGALPQNGPPLAEQPLPDPATRRLMTSPAIAIWSPRSNPAADTPAAAALPVASDRATSRIGVDPSTSVPPPAAEEWTRDDPPMSSEPMASEFDDRREMSPNERREASPETSPSAKAADPAAPAMPAEPSTAPIAMSEPLPALDAGPGGANALAPGQVERAEPGGADQAPGAPPVQRPATAPADVGQAMDETGSITRHAGSVSPEPPASSARAVAARSDDPPRQQPTAKAPNKPRPLQRSRKPGPRAVAKTTSAQQTASGTFESFRRPVSGQTTPGWPQTAPGWPTRE
jgi:hypothetical protein